MVDRYVLADKAYDKIANEAFNFVTGSICIKALPVDDEVKGQYIKPLFESATRFFNACGSSKLLSAAVENTQNKVSHALTGVYSDVIFSTAKEAADRIQNSSLAEVEDTITSAVSKAAMTSDEINRLKAKAENISIDEISNNIKKRTINVIKEERDMYEKEEAMKTDLQSALDASEAYKGVSVEEYRQATSKFSLDHETFFSKLQQMAFENLIYKVPYTEKDVFKTIDMIANECGVLIDGFNVKPNSFSAAVEEIKAYKAAGNEELAISPEDSAKWMDDAMFAAMVVYNMYETLNKLNFIKIDRDKLKEFIQTRTTMDPDSACKGDVATIKKGVKSMVVDATKDLNKEALASQVYDRINKLSSAKEALQTTDVFGFPALEDDEFAEEIQLLDKAIEACNDAICKMEQDTPDKYGTRANAAAFAERCRRDSEAANVIKCDRINKLFARRPEITDILLRIDPNQNFRKNVVIDAQGKSVSGQVVERTHVVLEPDCTRKPVELVKLAVESSGLVDTKQWNVSIMMDDGYGEKILVH